MSTNNGNTYFSTNVIQSNNSGSQAPQPMDIGAQADVAPKSYLWNDEEQKIIQVYRAYLCEMFNFVEALEKEGPVGKILPTKPRKDLTWLLNEKRKSSKLLTNTELHEYLAENIVGTNESVSCPPVTGVNLRTLEDALTYLKPGYVLLRRSNNANLCVCIDYGEWLNAVFELHYREKQAGRVWRSWKEWIEEEVGIQDSYARKLRDVAKLLRDSPLQNSGD